MAISKFEKTFTFGNKGEKNPPYNWGAQCTQEDRFPLTRVTAILEIIGNSNPELLCSCGWDRSHDSTLEKLSCLPL